jgi:hypothetical protein
MIKSTRKTASLRHAKVEAPIADPITPKGKLGVLVELLRRDGGAGITELSAATGWQAHSVRGAISGALKKQRGFKIASELVDGQRAYRIVSGAEA